MFYESYNDEYNIDDTDDIDSLQDPVSVLETPFD